MSYPHNLRVYADLNSPAQWGICDRCGFLRFLHDLPFQYDQRGNSVQNIRLRVCVETERCYDNAATTLRPIIIEGPEGVGLPDPRPTHYAQDNAGTGSDLRFAPANPMLPVIEDINGNPIKGLAPQRYEPGGPGV